MKKVAILLDLGFVLHKLYELLGKRHPTANEVHTFAQACINPSEEIFRIYCYHCPPYPEKQTHPVSKLEIDFSQSHTYTNMSTFLLDLKMKDNIAYRAGELSFDGWQLKPRATQEIVRTGRAIQERDFKPDIKQKGVDMKIGLDVAWLASKSIVDRIILVSSDSDLIPAMKFARREGVQVVLITLDHKQVKPRLIEHCDELRAVSFP